jgi:uncharacterized protein (DUF2235 family)
MRPGRRLFKPLVPVDLSAAGRNHSSGVTAMQKNVVILADGTGQRGGVLVDERRSNIYKLFRATRCGPDSEINPKEQVAFYDPGIGTLPAGMGFFFTLGRSIYNLVSQALGLGLTKNIIDGYSAVVRLSYPKDRVFLFGFSRGAYTARCIGAVVSLCGLPTRNADGSPLRRDEASCRSIAEYAVKHVYQHTSSWDLDDPKTTDRQRELIQQRQVLARRFRAKYASGSDEGPDDLPHFIGVFDTVASLSNPLALAFFVAAGLWMVAAAGLAIWYLFGPPGIASLFYISGSLVAAAALGSGLASLVMRVKSEIGLPRRQWWRLFHFAERRMQFYDKQLNPKIGYARHALSIDESRKSFSRVRWGEPKRWRHTGADEQGNSNPEWFEQLWFAGNHSDIGGSYPEDESRLSDVSLNWMLNDACLAGLKCDKSLLKLYPDPAGPQHDETRTSWVFRISAKSPRHIPTDAPLHDSVLQRFAAGGVLQFDVVGDYRPPNLKQHVQVRQFYAPTPAAAAPASTPVQAPPPDHSPPA